MKKMLNLFLAILIMFTTQLKSNAESINKVLSESNINKGAVSISIKDTKNGKVIYELNQKQPMMPASTLKLLTLAASLDTLGTDYEFKTQLYKNSNNELYFKLGADPFLRSKNIRNMIKTAKTKNIISPKAIYVDDFVFDSNEWGEGWQWDDDLSPLMPKFSSYNLDGNMLGIIIAPTTPGAPATISTSKFYPTTFMNLVTTGDTNNITLTRNNNISPDMITAEGTVVKQTVMPIPVNHPKRYFILRLEEAIRSEKFDYYGSFKQQKLPSQNVYLIEEYKTPILYTIPPILKDSNNFIAETVFKAAGGKFANNTGSQQNSLKMLEEYCKKEGLNTQDIKVVDGSGVSKNNIMTTDFMTEFLVKQAMKPEFETLKSQLPTSGEGTLATRMLYFKDNIRAKTGTLADVSAITGYLTTKNGKTFAFNIMINDPRIKNCDKKTLEEYILRAVYSSY